MTSVATFRTMRFTGRLRCRRATRAFTLLELLLALVITGVIASTLYGSMRIAMKARQVTSQDVQATASGWYALTSLGRDLVGVLPPRGVLAGTFIGVDETGSAGEDADELTFYTNNPMWPAAQPMGELVKVEVFLSDEDETTGDCRLVRAVTTNLLATTTPEPVTQKLARHVVSLNARYHDGSDWLDSWDSTQHNNTLPLAVELTLVLREDTSADAADDDESGQVTLRRVFRLPAATEVDESEQE